MLRHSEPPHCSLTSLRRHDSTQKYLQQNKTKQKKHEKDAWRPAVIEKDWNLTSQTWSARHGGKLLVRGRKWRMGVTGIWETNSRHPFHHQRNPSLPVVEVEFGYVNSDLLMQYIIKLDSKILVVIVQRKKIISNKLIYGALQKAELLKQRPVRISPGAVFLQYEWPKTKITMYTFTKFVGEGCSSRWNPIWDKHWLPRISGFLKTRHGKNRNNNITRLKRW